MNNPSSFLRVVAAAAAALLLTACGGGAPMEDDSPEYQAFAYRDSLMELAANRMALIGGMAREEIPLDEAKFVAATQQIAALASMNLEGFEMTETIHPASRALPDVYANWDDFVARNNDFVEAMQTLADTATTGGFSSAQGLVQGAAGTCGGCHRGYRQREE